MVCVCVCVCGGYVPNVGHLLLISAVASAPQCSDKVWAVIDTIRGRVGRHKRGREWELRYRRGGRGGEGER